MNESVALQTRNKMAKVYLGGIVAFSGMITVLVILIRMFTLNAS
ncbi:MAG: hypothetical protein RLZZ470_1698 [Pseudomonadota bacterium]|jgi:hypothetical protein